MSLKTKIAGAGAAVAVVIGTVGVAAGPAAAGTCTASQCGGLINDAASQRNLSYTLQWSSSPQVNWTLAPGASAGGRGSGVDVDGFLVPSGCLGWPSYGGGNPYTPGWHKIWDLSTFAIRLDC